MQANLRRSIGTLLMTTLALWLPLLPMFFFLWRAVQSRTGASRSKKDTTKASTPPVTFRSVADHAPEMYLFEPISKYAFLLGLVTSGKPC